MGFEPTPLWPAHVVVASPQEDSRGVFMRLHCETDFRAQGVLQRMVQTNLSRTRRRGTLRGLHFQIAPSHEGKLVRCLGGCIYDVFVNLRPESSCFFQHFAIGLDEGGLKALYVPPGFAHGFQALTKEETVLYQMTDYYAAELSRGVRWNDTAFGVAWPIADPYLSERDAGDPDFDARMVAGFVECWSMEANQV